MSAIQQWAESDSAPWAKVNANFDDVGVPCFAHRRAADSGLVVAYGGGNFDETAIVDGTVTCTDDDVNYIVVARATGVVSTSTATTNWDDTTTYGRMATATFAAGVLLSYLDERFSPGGIFDHSTTASGTVTHTGSLTANAVVLGNGTADIKPMASLGTTTTVLHGNAAGAPTFGAVSLTADVTGVLPVANFSTGTPTGSKFVRDDGVLALPAGAVGGTDVAVADGGTGASSLTAYAVLCGGTTSTAAVQPIASVGTSGHVLTSNGAGALPTFQAAASGAVATDTIWDAAGDLVQGTGSNTAARLALGTALQVLRVNAGATAAEWATASGGSTQGLHDLFIPAAAWYSDQTSGASWSAANGASDQPDGAYWAFDQTTEQAIWTVIEMPKSWDEGTITHHEKWSHPSTTTNFGVVWSLRAVALSDDDAWATSYGTAQTSTDTGGTTTDIYSSPESSAVTIAGTPATRDLVFIELRRKPSDGSDTLAVAAYLWGVTLQYTTNADTDA